MNIEKHDSSQHFDKTERINTYDFGQYFRYVGDDEILNETFQKDAIYPIVKLGIHHISNNVHNVTLFIPLHLRKSCDEQMAIVADVLETNFTSVVKLSAQMERKADLELLAEKTLEIQSTIQEALTSPHTIMDKIASETNPMVVAVRNKIDLSVPALPPASVVNSNSHDIVQTVGGQSLDVVRKQLENQKHLGEVISVYSKEKHKDLQETMNCVASINEEEARAAQGLANSMLERVSDVDSKIEQLSLYAGDEIAIEVIADCEPSTSKEKFTFFSHLIYCDEEMLTHKIFSDASFDSDNLGDFFLRLRKDDAFRNRMLPTERCVVVARPRRNAKHYSDNAFENYFRNQYNFNTFTLIKDGERVCVMFSPIDAQARLFPTQEEMDSYLNDVQGIDDAKLTDAQKRIKYLNANYTKFAAILQGILDRQETGGKVVFGELPAHKPMAAFFDPTLVAQNVTFINDEDNLIADNGITNNAKDWLNKQTVGNFTQGDLIFVDGEIITEGSAPSLYSKPVNINESKQLWWFDERPYEQLKIVTLNSKGLPCVKVRVDNNHYDSSKHKTKVASVDLTDATYHVRLNTIKPRELDLILESRVARPFISNDIRTLISARGVIQNTLLPNLDSCINQYLSIYPDTSMSRDDVYVTLLNVAAKNGLDVLSPVTLSRKQFSQARDIELHKFIVDENVINKLRGDGSICIGTDGLSNFLLTNDTDATLENERFINVLPQVKDGIKNHEKAIYGVKCFCIDSKANLTPVDLSAPDLSALEIVHDYIKESVGSVYMLNNLLTDSVIQVMQATHIMRSPKNTTVLNTIQSFEKSVGDAISSSNPEEKVRCVDRIITMIKVSHPFSKLSRRKYVTYPLVKANAFITYGKPHQHVGGKRLGVGEYEREYTYFSPRIFNITFNPVAAIIKIMLSCEDGSVEQDELNKTISEFMNGHLRMSEDLIARYFNDPEIEYIKYNDTLVQYSETPSMTFSSTDSTTMYETQNSANIKATIAKGIQAK